MFENHKKVSFNTDSESCEQRVLPDRLLLIEQKLVENAKIEKIQMRHFGDFRTL